MGKIRQVITKDKTSYYQGTIHSHAHRHGIPAGGILCRG